MLLPERIPYDEAGNNRRENITDWALSQFQARYGPAVTKQDIFHYVYALLHHPDYRQRYAENIKRELPRIPFVGDWGVAQPEAEAVEATALFRRFVAIGARLADLHLNYERAPEYNLRWIENRERPFSWRVEKLKLAPDKTTLIVNDSLTLGDIPPEAFAYRLGHRSALEWVIDQYRIKTDKRSGLISDPNRPDDEEYIVRLIGRVISVSVETVRLVDELIAIVRGV